MLARGWDWPRFYIISVCLGCINTVFTAYTFHTTREEFQEEKAKALELLRQETETYELENPAADTAEEATPQRVSRPRSRSRGPGAKSGTCSRQVLTAIICLGGELIVAMRVTLAQPVVWIFAIFLCMYTGVCDVRLHALLCAHSGFIERNDKRGMEYVFLFDSADGF